ncbi:MAG TPA: hypothetical protein VID74_04665, partial [Gemmatimonadales bacterium]
MKFVSLVLAAMLAAAPLGAQGPAPVVLSLQDALARAEAASPNVGIARAGVTSARADWLRARSAALPQLSGSVTYTRTLASQFSGLFGNSSSDTFPVPINCGHFH